jgi:hypothetical protein
MKTLHTSQSLEANKDIVEFRLHCLNHLATHGIKSFLSAFPNVGKSTVYDWRRIFRQSRNNPASLIPKSTRPKRLRQMRVDHRLVEFIAKVRNSDCYGFMGKDKLKPLLDAYARDLGIPSISTGTIGKIIKKRRLNKMSHANQRKSPKKLYPGEFTI